MEHKDACATLVGGEEHTGDIWLELNGKAR
jgi:hypothetical protein